MRTGLLLLATHCLLVVGVATGVVVAVPAASVARGGEVVNVAAPGIAGDAVFDQLLRAGPGRWDPAEVEVTYRWLRDGAFVRGARERTYRLVEADLGHRVAVQVTATDAEGGTGTAVSEETPAVARATFEVEQRPSVSGVLRYSHTLTADPGRFTSNSTGSSTRFGYQWLRADIPITGATSPRYPLGPEDVGKLVRVQVTASAPGYRTATASSVPQTRVRHRVDVRRKVTYSVTTRGRVTASLETFRRLAQETYDDARGWRAKGVEFRRVRSGGSFTLVLAEASTVPSFSSECSATYSCRVGRYLIINQTRWQHASPPWNAAGESLRDYRNLVVNHETGHWLGKGHASCPGNGRLAPVMMQQSKGNDGCRFNPWPTAAELR